MTVNDAELAGFDGLALAELVRRRQVTALELVDAAIDRVERLDPKIGFMAERWYEEARARAQNDEGRDGPFGGVPFLVKDLIWIAGKPMRYGSVLCEDFVAPATHPVADRFSSSGLIGLGRTKTCELGLLPVTESALYGPTHNPWNLRFSPGGSSGGSAAAVAASVVPLAHGNDGGGSIRIPAACCGVFGLKASRGRHPQGPFDEPFGLTSEGCLSRTVRDSAAFLDVIQGAGPSDKYMAPPRERPFLDEVGRDPGALRIRFTTKNLSGEPVHRDCVEAVESAARLCEGLGHRVEAGTPAIDGDGFYDAFMLLWAAIPTIVIKMALDEVGKGRAARLLTRVLGQRRTFAALSRLSSLSSGKPLLEPFTAALADRAYGATAAELAVALAHLETCRGELARFFEAGTDIWMTPVVGAPPMRTGELHVGLGPAAFKERLIAHVAFTPLCNAAGLPAMSVPLHWNDGGLPIGVHFVARYGDEATLLRLAAQLEQAAPWRHRAPEVR